MKTPYVIGLVAVSVLITVAIEETRIASIRGGAKSPDASAAVRPSGVPTAGGDSNEPEAGSVRTRSRTERETAAAGKPAPADDESIAKTVRKMWDNPAGKTMMNQGVKIAVAMMYEDFIEGLELTKEESGYLKTLLGQEMSDQQELGMKLMSATPEERKALMADIEQRKKDNEAEIEKFLNSDDDYRKFTEYKERLPERQQLDGIRATMESKGAPMDAETESKLVEAMHRVRTEAKGPDFSGPEAIEELAKGGFAESFEQNWQSQQDTLRAETSGVLSPEQQEAFQEYQKQLKDMQLMGLKMAEKMMKEKGSDED
jgi:hypothetical protein